MPFSLPTLSAFALAGLLSGLPQLGRAQAVGARPPLPRYYLGLGGAVGGYAQQGAGTESILAPTLTGGLRPTPRLALELSLLVYHSRDDQLGQGIYVDTLGGGASVKPAIFRSVHQQRTQVLALAARYTLWQPRTGRLSLDALGGLALVHTDGYGYNATLDQATGQPVVGGGAYARYDRTGGGLLLGPSLRYQASPHLALVGEFIGNFAPGERPARLGRVAGTLGLSVRYCFGPAVALRRQHP